MNNTNSGLSYEERQSVTTLWAMANTPMYLGGDLTTLDNFGKQILTNDEVLAVNQSGHPAIEALAGACECDASTEENSDALPEGRERVCRSEERDHGSVCRCGRGSESGDASRLQIIGVRVAAAAHRSTYSGLQFDGEACSRHGRVGDRRDEVEAGQAVLRERLGLELLRDAKLTDLETCKNEMSSASFLRCRHIIRENGRVVGAREALLQGDVKRFGSLMV